MNVSSNRTKMDCILWSNCMHRGWSYLACIWSLTHTGAPKQAPTRAVLNQLSHVAVVHPSADTCAIPPKLLKKRILNQKTLSNSHFNPIPYTALLRPFCLSLSFWISFPLSPSLARRRLFQWLSRSCTGWCSCPFPAPASSCFTSCSTQSSTSPPEQTSPNMSEAETFRQKPDPG